MHGNCWNAKTRVFNDEEGNDFRSQRRSYYFALASAGGYCLNRTLKRLSLVFPSFFRLPPTADVVRQDLYD